MHFGLNAPYAFVGKRKELHQDVGDGEDADECEHRNRQCNRGVDAADTLSVDKSDQRPPDRLHSSPRSTPSAKIASTFPHEARQRVPTSWGPSYAIGADADLFTLALLMLRSRRPPSERSRRLASD